MNRPIKVLVVSQEDMFLIIRELLGMSEKEEYSIFGVPTFEEAEEMIHDDWDIVFFSGLLQSLCGRRASFDTIREYIKKTNAILVAMSCFDETRIKQIECGCHLELDLEKEGIKPFLIELSEMVNRTLAHSP